MNSNAGWVAALADHHDSPEAARAGVAAFYETVGLDGSMLGWTTSDSDDDAYHLPNSSNSNNVVQQHYPQQEISSLPALQNAINSFKGKNENPCPNLFKGGRCCVYSRSSAYEIPAVPSLITSIRNKISWAAAIAAASDKEGDDFDFDLTVTPIDGRNTVTIRISTLSWTDLHGSDEFFKAVDKIILSNEPYTQSM
jgi:hypothetical protein